MARLEQIRFWLSAGEGRCAVETVRTNRQAVTEYIVAGQTDFYRLAYSYVKDRETALDIVQESVVKALTKADSLREPAYLKTWFYRILINECMNCFRRGKRVVPLDETVEGRAAPERDEAERLDLYDAIARLGEKEQTIIKLRFFEDMKLEEIAQATRTNLNTVKSRLYKALGRLRELTGEELSDE